MLNYLKLTACLPPENKPGPKRKRESLPTIYFQDAILVSGSVDEAHGFKLGFLCYVEMFNSCPKSCYLYVFDFDDFDEPRVLLYQVLSGAECKILVKNPGAEAIMFCW